MTVDLSQVPLVALSSQSKELISTLLNPPKVIPSEDGFPRDWRGLAHLSSLNGEAMPSLASHPDPSSYILSKWEQNYKAATIKDLQEILQKLDRWDIVDDTTTLFCTDGEKYLQQLEKSQTSAEAAQIDVDNQVLTVDDLYRFRQGLETQYYDAFLLYADEDAHFATEMIKKLEDECKLKLCVKDRDLVGGITFEHEAVMTLISERCNRLIVIVSPNFLKSPVNKFFLNYAHALGIDKRQRKIIPCLYEKCKLPVQLSYMFILDYNRVGLYDFWGKLRDSVQTAVPVKQDVKCAENTTHGTNICNGYYEFDPPDKSTEQVESIKGTVIPNPSCSIPIVAAQNTLYNSQTGSNPSTPPSGSAKSLKVETLPRVQNILQWTKKKLIRKSESDKADYQAISETLTIPNLPSLENLDTLDSSTSTTKKHKAKFMNKYMKKVQLKKILVK